MTSIDVDLTSTVASAVAGDAAAWDVLVDRFSGLVWSVARSSGLSWTDAADVSQTAWLRLAENLRRIRDPEHVGGWLATTTRREARRVARHGEIPLSPGDDAHRAFRALASPAADANVSDEEESHALWAAFERLPPPCRMLLRMLMSDPSPAYADVSDALDMPVGSIGPRRRRCLEVLRRQIEPIGNGAGSTSGRHG